MPGEQAADSNSRKGGGRDGAHGQHQVIRRADGSTVEDEMVDEMDHGHSTSVENHNIFIIWCTVIV